VSRQGTLALRAPTADSIYFAPVTVSDAAAGRWEATLDWANEANTLWIWVAGRHMYGGPVCEARLSLRSDVSMPLCNPVRDRYAETTRAQYYKQRSCVANWTGR